MDQLKTAGLWLRKNYFWVSCGVVTLIFLGVWFFTTSRLANETEARTSALNSKRQTGQNISTEPNHPNPITHAKMDERIKYTSNEVYEAWLQQYDKQTKLLTWPTILGPDFLDIVDDLQPIEAKVPFPIVQEPLPQEYRAAYRSFIDRELPKIAQIVGAQWVGGTTSSAGNLMNQQDQTESTALVEWMPGNQSQFASRFQWGPRIPTTLEILYAQEDIWVMKSIMGIIKATNGDVEHRFQAPVKTITSIEFGRDTSGAGGAGVAGAAGGSSSLMSSSSGSASMGGMSSRSMAGGSMMMGGMGSSSSTTEGETPDPGDDRYVDMKYEALKAEKIRSALKSTSPDDAFLMVAKRIPVRIRVKVDQRKLTKLLAECGNASMQLEIRQVRINRPGAGGSMMGSGSGAAGSSGGGMMSSPTSMGSGGGMSSGASMPSGGSSAMSSGGGSSGAMRSSGGSGGMRSSGPMGSGGSMRSSGGGAGMGPGMAGGGISDESPYDIDVELFGIIYIYNPVDHLKLGKTIEEAPAATEPPADEVPPATARKEEEAQPVAAAG